MCAKALSQMSQLNGHDSAQAHVSPMEPVADDELSEHEVAGELESQEEP